MNVYPNFYLRTCADETCLPFQVRLVSASRAFYECIFFVAIIERDCRRRKSSRNKNTKVYDTMNNYDLRRRKSYAVKASFNRIICDLTYPCGAKYRSGKNLYAFDGLNSVRSFFTRKISANFKVVV